MPFDDATKRKVLLWCDRHCCLCKKACGTNIEVHHIVPEAEGGDSTIDNAIPLCFDCHGSIEHYNPKHPKGSNYKSEEIKARREQIYEEFTRNLVPIVYYEIRQQVEGGEKRTFPDIGFRIQNMGKTFPIRAKVNIIAKCGDKSRPIQSEYYSGNRLWNLNPRFAISGHFDFPSDLLSENGQKRLHVQVSLINQYERDHDHLPVEYAYDDENQDWFLEP
jgi:hypothetical protein